MVRLCSSYKNAIFKKLTIDFTGEICRPENDAIKSIAIFPDMVDGTLTANQ
ncbi:hypothetical protein GNIT_0431 [Glaciecola nitratireducens FR1064]|uniref:Uncharacterized protein n=1 Tax=Glaciecola nitratireducens (strain JCM 12485 / KCTC 12276 / FR1064) TaxID=1085623 RepID=G4QJH9_GLANF|nr:hypothetical protein GNIT_0431 [Glaciecola nitratireducens FR1064]